MEQKEKRRGEGRSWTFKDGTLTLLAAGDAVLAKLAALYGGTTILWAELRPQIGAVRICDGVKEIPASAFANCSLTGAAIPGSVISIGAGAFQGCWTLTSVYIAGGVKTVGGQAFDGCGRLTDVYYGGSEEQWKQISIGDGNEALKNANIHFNC